MTVVHRLLGLRSSSPPWNDPGPVREELFSEERLEQHAESLAVAQPVTERPATVLSLHARLDDNAAVLLAAYRSTAAELESGRGVVPAAEWLLDNYHLVEEQIREIREDLPPGYYRQLPKLADGPLAGYPRVLGLAWAFVAHTDSLFDREKLRKFLVAYQRVQPLTIGELWAVAITLRIVLVENLRRLADQMTVGRAARADAEALSGKLLLSGSGRTALDTDIASRSPEPLSEVFAAHLAKELRNQDPATTPALGWLEERLALQGVSVETVVQHAQQRQGASNVTVRNIVTSMRLISDIDWAEMFESVSLVDARLRAHSAFADMDFPTRDLYRTAIEQLARGSSCSEMEIADHALDAARRTEVQADRADDAGRTGDPGFHLIAQGRQALERAIRFKASPRLRISRFNTRLGIGGYVGSILFLTGMLLAIALWLLSRSGLDGIWLLPAALVGFLPATEVATTLVNRAMTWSFGATILPGLALKQGVPPSLRTLVAVPTLLTSEADLLEQAERLEVHHLSGVGGDLAAAGAGRRSLRHYPGRRHPLAAGCRAPPDRQDGASAQPPAIQRHQELRHRRLRHLAAARHALASGRPGRVHLPARVLRSGRYRSLGGRGVGRVPGSLRRRHLYGQGHLRRRCVRSLDVGPRARERNAQPRSLRGCLRPRRARVRRRGHRGVPVPI